MLHRPLSRLFFAGTALLTLVTMPGPAPADIFYDTVYVPTSAVVSVPGSSILSTSSVMPTTYVVPGSFSSGYLPTTYVMPTASSGSYLPTSAVYSSDPVLFPTSTSYYRRSLFRPRRYFERASYRSYYAPSSTFLPASYLSTYSIMPTSSMMPMTYVSSSMITPASSVVDGEVVRTSASDPCETTSTAPPARASAGKPSGESIFSQPSNTGSSSERKPTAIMSGTPSSDENIPPPAPTPPAPAPVVSTVPPKAPTGSAAGAPEPPVVVDPDRAKAGALGTGGGTTGGFQLPAPGASGTGPNEMQYRISRRPPFDMRNILRGRVISADSKQPEEGVSVIVSSLTKATFVDRQAMTDADGEFKVSLPDGDWAVKVKMPSGSIFTVGQNYVTASGGKVTDASGRTVADFLIQR